VKRIDVVADQQIVAIAAQQRIRGTARIQIAQQRLHFDGSIVERCV
jgi:hypothetical protein